jgi:sugar-specific transcriptional regulator TrmB
MSTTEGRKQRIERLLKCLNHYSSHGLTANEIAHKTQLLTEITMDRLYKYLAELEWSGIIEQTDLHYHVVYASSLKNERERRRIKEREMKKEKEREVAQSEGEGEK